LSGDRPRGGREAVVMIGRHRRLAGAPVMLCAVLACVPPAFGQVTTGTILGTITDGTGAALPGATVTVRRTETDTKRSLVTDGEGRYRVVALEPGTYEVLIELSGFQPTRRGGVALAIGQDAVVNATLQIGALNEAVVVTENAPLVTTTSSAVASLVDEKQIRDLPLNGRDFSQLTLLQPGIVSVPTTARSLDRGMGTQVSIAGARPNQISYLMDGTDVNFQGNQSPGSAAGGMLGVETVREFQVLANNYSAEYGRSAGGVVSAVTRSGTNDLHGSAFEFFRNDALDSKNYFDPKDEPIPPFTRNQPGFYVGGPLKRDRTFFFGSYEGLRQDKGLSLVARVPSTATRARTDISPATRRYLLMYPEANAGESGQSGLYVTSINEPTRENYFVVKVDHNFSNNDSVAVRYSFDDASVVTPQGLPLFSDRAHTRGQFFTAEHKRILTSRLLNVFRFAWNRAFEETVNIDNIPVDPAMFFIPGTQFGTISVSGLTPLGTDTGTPTFVNLKSLQFINQLTWTTGRNGIKTGVSWTYWMNDQDSSFDLGGAYTFNSIEDFVVNRAGTFEGTFPGSTTARGWRQSLVGLFVQDDMTLSSRVTINAGVRYEFITSPREKEDRVASLRNLLDPATTPGYPLFENPSLRNIAPRAGFAWDVTGDGKTSVRGGAGVFYEPILGNLYRAYGNRTPPYFRLLNVRNPTFPDPFTVLTPRNRLDLVQYDLKNPYRVQYNATLQREVARQMVVTAGYVGSRGYHQIRNIEANQANAQVLPDGRYFFPQGGARRNPNFESIRLRLSDGNSWYNGLILGANKRFSRGLLLQASYTFGKSRDEGSQAIGSGDFDNSFQPRYGFDRRDNRGLSDFDIRHNFVFNYSYELPFGAAASGAAGALARGWQVSGVVTLRSGVPFTPVLGFDRARALPRSGGAGQRPNWAPGYDRSGVILGGATQYFDPLAFTLPDAGYFGDVERNALIGPGFAAWDAAVFKNISVKSRRVQLRLELFNVLNRANFGLPSATVFNSAGRVENAGEITSTVGTARQVQLGVKVEF
jgi:carboxypeptidase family protein/TonB-dependent receptor-like protein